MKNKKLHKYLAWLLVLAVIFSLGSIGNPAEVMAKSKKAAVVKSVSLKIESKKVMKKTYKMKRGDRKKIKVSVCPKKSKKTIKFTTSNKKVATVNKSGWVTAKKVGTSKITVTVRLRKTGKSRVWGKKSTWVKIKVLDRASSDKTKDTPATEPPETEPPATQNPTVKKSIVAYFSCTDNTKTIAEYVAESAGADIYRIEAAVPYTSTDLNYNNSDSRTSKEQNDPLARPEIAGEFPSLDQYENVYLGYPIWWGQAPKIMYTFVEHYNLSGKTVIPFCTSASSGIGTSATNLQAADTSQAVWLAGRRFSGSSPKSDVENWLAGLGLQ